MELIKNRSHAGKMLADLLQNYANDPQTMVLALPRGGVPVAYEIAKRLQLPLDAWLVRKIGLPQQREVAIGAISLGYVKVLNEAMIQHFKLNPNEINQIIAEEEVELERRNRRYRDNRPIPRLTNKTLILIDDGVATGATMQASVMALKKFNPKKIIVAVPIGSSQACQELEEIVDELVCLYSPEPFGSVAKWYENFDQVDDKTVTELLKQAEVLYRNHIMSLEKELA
jgi:putative phosphoribosyl transferase